MNKAEKILKIKESFEYTEWITSSEMELESSPCLKSIGNGKNNISELVDDFYPDQVMTSVYHDDILIEQFTYPYESLPEDIIDEIYNIFLNYNPSK